MLARFAKPLRQVVLFTTISGAMASTAGAQTVFTNSSRYPSDRRPLVTAVGYVDGDTHLDCVVTNYYSNTLSVYLGTGTGTFTPVADSTMNGNPRGLALGDMNGDGLLDAVVTIPSGGGLPSAPGKVRVLFGDGLGGFTPGLSKNAHQFPVWVDLGDVNGDSLLDIVAGNQGSNDVTVLLATGSGTFGAPTHFPTGGFSCEEIALGDIDGDGDLDLAVGSWLDSRVVAMRGDGIGGFTVANSLSMQSPKSIKLADMDSNGTLDLVAVSSQGEYVAVMLGTPAGTWTYGHSRSTDVYPTGVAVVDVNSDGVPDVVASCTSGRSLSLFVGTGNGKLAHAIDSPVTEAPGHMSSGDFNGDGLSDVVVTEGGSDHLSMHLCDGVGSYVTYCTAKVNSYGCLPAILAYGTPSISNMAPFFIRAFNLAQFQSAMFIYKVGGAQANLPFSGGTLCVGPGGVRRTPIQNTGGDLDIGDPCLGSAYLNFNDFSHGLAGGNPDPALLMPGNTYHVQLWGRDSGDPLGTTLSDAIEVRPWL